MAKPAQIKDRISALHLLVTISHENAAKVHRDAWRALERSDLKKAIKKLKAEREAIDSEIRAIKALHELVDD